MTETEIKNIMDALFGMRVQNKRDTSENWKLNDPVLLEGEIGFETNTGRFKFGNGDTNWNDLPYAAIAPTDIQTLMTFRGAVNSYYHYSEEDEGNQNLTIQFAYGIIQGLYKIPNVTLDSLQVARLYQVYNDDESDEDWREVANEILPDECIGTVINVADEGVNYVWVGINNDYDPEDDERTDFRKDGWEKLGALITTDISMPDFLKNISADTYGTLLTNNPVSEYAVYKFIYDYLNDKNMIQEIKSSDVTYILDIGIYQLTQDFDVYYTDSDIVRLSQPLFLVLDNSTDTGVSDTRRWVMIGQGYNQENLYICQKQCGTSIADVNKDWTILNTNIITDKESLSSGSDIKQLVDQSVIKDLFDKIGDWNGSNTITTAIDTATANIDIFKERIETDDIKDLNDFYLSSINSLSKMAFFNETALNAPNAHDGVVFVVREDDKNNYQIVFSPYDGEIYFRKGIYDLTLDNYNWSNWLDYSSSIKNIIGSSFNATNTIEAAISALNETAIIKAGFDKNNYFNINTHELEHGIYELGPYVKGYPDSTQIPQSAQTYGFLIVINIIGALSYDYEYLFFNNSIYCRVVTSNNQSPEWIKISSSAEERMLEINDISFPQGSTPNNPLSISSFDIINLQRTTGVYYYQTNENTWNTLFGENTDFNKPWPNITVDNFPTTRIFRLDVEDYYSGAEKINVTNTERTFSMNSASLEMAQALTVRMVSRMSVRSALVLI